MQKLKEKMKGRGLTLELKEEVGSPSIRVSPSPVTGQE